MLNDVNRKLGINAGLSMYKTGGSTSAYQKRSVAETQAVNAHKANLEAVKNLDKEVLQILNKLLSR